MISQGHLVILGKTKFKKRFSKHRTDNQAGGGLFDGRQMQAEVHSSFNMTQPSLELRTSLNCIAQPCQPRN